MWGDEEDGSRPRSLEDLSRLPLLRLSEIDDPAEFVLRPDWTSIDAGDQRFAMRLALTGFARRRQRRAERLVAHRYKPVHWTIDAGTPVGSSSADLGRLARLGARWLDLAGVGPADVLVGVSPPGPHLAFWQLVTGAREAGVSAVHLPPPAAAEEVSRLCPTVLAGRPFDLARLLASARADGHRLTSVRTLLALGEPLEDGVRAKLLQLLELAPEAAVVGAWAPPGVRALWGECRQGSSGQHPRAGLHTWPDAEVLEVIDPLSGTAAPPGADGEVVWTAVGWSGSVFVRLRTGVFATIDTGACPACRMSGPRLSIVSDTPAFLTALDRHPEVMGWQAELRTVAGREELLVFMSLAPAAAGGEGVLRELDSQLSATQYVVVDAQTLDSRMAAHDDRRVIDLRRR